MKGRGRGGLIERGGACRLSSSEKGGGGRGGLIEDLRYVTFLSQHTITISSLRTRLKQKKKKQLLLISPCDLITQY